MLRLKRNPGCPCCTPSPCVIATDDLAGPTYSDTWTLKTGSWDDVDVVSTYASATGIVEAWHKTPHPDDPYPSDVRVRVRGAAGSILRIVLSASGDVATGDALIVELAPGADCGTLKLYQRQGGVEDVLATLAVYGAIVDEWHDLRACYDPEATVLTGSILPHDETSWRQTSVEVEAHTDGASAGFASGTDDQSDFDTFVYRKLWYDRIITPLCPQMGIETTQTTHAGLDGDYYYEPETERVTCSTCKINCGLIPAQYGIVGNAPLACLADAKSGTWTIAPVGLCNMGIGGYDYLPPLQSDADWIGLQSLQSTGAGEIVFSSDRGVHEIPHYVGFEICSPTDTTVYRCYWSYPDEYLDVWITQDEETLTRELHIQPVGGVQYDGGESLSGIVCDRISVQVCRLEFGAVVGAIATRVYGGERELISYVSSISIELSEWTAPTYAGISVPESTLCKFFVTRHAQNDPDCPGCQSCDSDQCSPGNRPNEVVRITIPTGVVPGYSGAEPFPVEIDLASLFGSYVADTVPENTMCRWQALILDAWRCSSITCPSGGNPLDGLYLGNSSVPAQCLKCGTARNVYIEDDVYDPPGWDYYPFTWNGICLFATASIRNPFGESLGGWGVTLSLGYQSSVDLPTEKGDVPFAFPLYGSTAMYCFKYNPTGNEYVWYKVQGRATYVASFAADGSGCTEEIVLTKIPAGSPVAEVYLPIEPEGVYEGVWPDTIRLNPRP